jgi:hypothetical protein
MTLPPEMIEAMRAALESRGTIVHNLSDETLEAVFTAALSAAWRPIESHPKYGDWIPRCLFGREAPWGWSQWIGQCDNGDIWLGVGDDGACWECGKPTHYCDSLPPPPERTE